MGARTVPIAHIVPPLALLIGAAVSFGYRQQVNAVVASVCLTGATVLLLDVWMYRRRLLKKAALWVAMLSALGLSNAVCAWLEMRPTQPGVSAAAEAAAGRRRLTSP